MPEPLSKAVAAILASLRQEIKGHGVRVKDLAEDLGIAEPTLWRWLRGQGLTLEHLDRLCQRLGLDMRDLISNMRDNHPAGFTLAQERILAADRGLGLLFFAILNGAQRDNLANEFGLTTERVEHYLARLRRLALINISPSGRLRPLVTRAVKWRPGGPLAVAFERTIKHFFLDMDFSAKDALYVSDMVRVSEPARARIHGLFEVLRADIHTIAEQDRVTLGEQRAWSSVLMSIRELDIAGLTKDLR